MNSTTTDKIMIAANQQSAASSSNFLIAFERYLTLYFDPVTIIMATSSNVMALTLLAERSKQLALSPSMHLYYASISMADLFTVFASHLWAYSGVLMCSNCTVHYTIQFLLLKYWTVKLGRTYILFFCHLSSDLFICALSRYGSALVFQWPRVILLGSLFCRRM